MRRMETMKKVWSVLLAISMVFSWIPVPAHAAQTDGLCEHHPVHTAECHYAEAVEGHACGHTHTEDCYRVVACQHVCGTDCATGCTHVCSVEDGCVTMKHDCHHTHGDCGYSEGTAEIPCGHVCGEECVEVCVHTEHDETCGYAPPTEGTPCTHVCAVKVASSESCYQLLCSHKGGGHDDACGYVAAVAGHECHYECNQCENAFPSGEGGTAEAVTEEGALLSQESQIPDSSPERGAECTCGTDDDTVHATNCPAYVAPETPVCYCVEKCTEPNVWCDVCGFDVTACTGEDTAVAYDTTLQLALAESTGVDGNTLGSISAYFEQDNISSQGDVFTWSNAAEGDVITISDISDIDGYTHSEEIVLTVNADLSVTVTSGNASISLENGIYYISITMMPENGYDIDCSALEFGVYSGYSVEDVPVYLTLNLPCTYRLKNTEGLNSKPDGFSIGSIVLTNGAKLEAFETPTFYRCNIEVRNGTITGGTYDCPVKTEEGGSITDGTFSFVNNYGTITDGTFSVVDNYGTITGGTFNGVVRNYGSIVNNGGITLGENFSIEDTGGTITCNSHIWRNATCRLCGAGCAHDGVTPTYAVSEEDSTKHIATYSCCGATVTEDHSTGAADDKAATCTDPAYCSRCQSEYGDPLGHSTDAEDDIIPNCQSAGYCTVCKSSYGEVDLTNHDASLGYDANGFCVNGCYEPAKLVDGVYQIANAGQLLWFAQKVNGGETTLNAILTADIEMSGIKTWVVMESYGGTFDGDGHKIVSLNQNTGLADGNRQGFIKNLVSGGSVTDLTFENPTVFVQSGIGLGVIAYNNAGTISGCIVSGASIQLGDYVGLGVIAGKNLSGGVIENCAAINCTLTRRYSGANNQAMGGITQTNSGTVKNCYTYGCTFKNGTSANGAIIASGTAPENCYYYTAFRPVLQQQRYESCGSVHSTYRGRYGAECGYHRLLFLR